MRIFYVLILALPIFSCASKHQPAETTSDSLQTADQNISVDSIAEVADNFPERGSIRLEFEGYENNGYASVMGKPIDSTFGATKTFILYDDKTIYSDSSNNFIYYAKLKDYWPRLLKNESHYIYMFERNVGEPEGSDVFVVTFTKDSVIDTFSIKFIENFTVLANKLSDSELLEIYNSNKR